MNKRMLIDAVHPEETRVAVVSNSQVEDFDFETAGREQLRGNIYLAKVTRVEPSLQAAFVEYGGNRHGFLAFSEIHPDYYQLPQADRDALLKEAAAAAAEAAEDDDEDEDEENAATAGDDSGAEEDDDEDGETTIAASKPKIGYSQLKKYKIQEVIRRRQVMLVQVVKEERGNKGAALTTYLSLAGRYSVLMPNTPSGGGISRKIPNGTDRKRLKKVMSELNVPDGMGLIVRTAGAKRTKTEIKRDYDYLLKLWSQIRETTLTSMAPCLINQEGGLVHRAIRDMFDKDVEEVLIEGEAAYKEAKDLARLLMPSHARRVKQWKDPLPLFVDWDVEAQLDSIYSPTVPLKSGGYLVINQTEALVAIDVNSGKATKARNIEQTALRTNMEAAEEACRQMRLRDLAGLVVIDFIDMDEPKNNRAVEKRLKDCLKIDRARVQAGRISQFGLMEISRQRRRAGVLQATSDPCEACHGTGRVRSVPSAALQLVRAIEARAGGGGLKSVTLEAPTEVALYLFNHKRESISEIEATNAMTITVSSVASLLPGEFNMSVERDPDAPVQPKRSPRRRSVEEDTSDALAIIDADDADDEDEGDEEDMAEALTGEADIEGDSDGEEDSDSSRKRRRRGRRGGRRRRKSPAARPEGAEATEADRDEESAGEEAVAAEAASPAPATQKPPANLVPVDGGAYLDGLSVTPGELLEAAQDTVAAETASIATTPDAEADAGAQDAPVAEAEEASPSRSSRRRRPRRRRKSEDGAADGSGESDPAMADGPAEPHRSEAFAADAEPPAPPAAATRETEPEPMLETDHEALPPAGAEGSDIAAETSDVEAEPEPEPAQTSDASDPAPDIAGSGTAEAEEPEPEPEPVREPVLIGADDAGRPKRRGWWNRR